MHCNYKLQVQQAGRSRRAWVIRCLPTPAVRDAFSSRVTPPTKAPYSEAVYHGRPSGEVPTPTLESIIRSDPEILGGTPVFVGTRVPVKNLLDYLAAGDSLETFLDDFPSVTREQAVATLDIAKDLLTARAPSTR